MEQKQSKLNSNTKRPKIALFHYSGPPLVSGVDVIIRDHARLFRLFNYKVEIVAGQAKQFRKDIPVHAIKLINPRNSFVYKIRQELEKGIVSDTFYNVEKSLYKSLKRYLIKNNIKVCILHNLFTRHYNLPLTSALAKLATEFPEIKFIAWVHDVNFYDDPFFKLDKNLRKIFPWNILVNPVPNMTYVCVSEFLKDNLIQAFGKVKPLPYIDVIPNLNDIPKFLGLSPVMRQFYDHMKAGESDLIACAPVRAVARKRLELSIEVAKKMVERGINFKLILTANVDYKRVENLHYYNSLKTLVAEYKLEDHVYFLEEYFKKLEVPGKPKPRIPVTEIYLISDFLLMTSILEGFGLPVIEAGLLRCPIFATDIPPFREIGTTNIDYFSKNDKADKICSFILKEMEKKPHAYFYRKIIKQFGMRKTFKEKIIPFIESLVQDSTSS